MSQEQSEAEGRRAGAVEPPGTAAEAVAGDGAVGAEPELDMKRVALSVAGTVAAIMTALAIFGALFWEPLIGISKTYVETLGGPGVALGFFFPDGLTIPMPVDAFAAFGLFGGLGFWPTVAWGSVGSICGGCLGYLVGRQLKHTPWFRRFMARRGAEMHGLVRRYGVAALAAAALTPLPYSVACWACGALDMPFGRFLAVSLLRAPRVAGYLYLIELGFISFTP